MKCYDVLSVPEPGANKRGRCIRPDTCLCHSGYRNADWSKCKREGREGGHRSPSHTFYPSLRGGAVGPGLWPGVSLCQWRRVWPQHGCLHVFPRLPWGRLCRPGTVGLDFADQCSCHINGEVTLYPLTYPVMFQIVWIFQSDHISGACQCSAGWQGALCDGPCPPGSHGYNCTKSCQAGSHIIVNIRAIFIPSRPFPACL